MRGLVDLGFDLGQRRRQIGVGGDVFRTQEIGEPLDGIAGRFVLTFCRRLVERLIGGLRVRGRPGDARVHERGALAARDIGGRRVECPVAGDLERCADRLTCA